MIENSEQNTQQETENGALNNLGNKVEPMLLSAMNSCPEIHSENGSHVADEAGGEIEAENGAPTNGEDLPERKSEAAVGDRANDENSSHEATNPKCCNGNSSSNGDSALTNGLCEEIATLDIKNNSLNACDSMIVNTSNIVEDCDILTNRKSRENSEDCSKIVDELEMRLMNEENSVQSSVETIVDTNFSNGTGDPCEYKYVHLQILW